MIPELLSSIGFNGWSLIRWNRSVAASQVVGDEDCVVGVLSIICSHKHDFTMVKCCWAEELLDRLCFSMATVLMSIADGQYTLGGRLIWTIETKQACIPSFR